MGKKRQKSDGFILYLTLWTEYSLYSHELGENISMISGGSLKVPNCVLFIRKTITHRVKLMRLKGIAFNGMRSLEASSEKCSNRFPFILNGSAKPLRM